MSFNRENFIKVKNEFEEKANRAEELADARARDAERAIPELKAINAELATTGLQILTAIREEPTKAKALLKEIEARNKALQAEKRRLLAANGFPEDYTEPKYECDDCSDTGYVDGKMCHCMREALILAGYDASGIGKLLRTQNFDNFSLDYYKNNRQNYEIMSRALEIVKSYAENFDVKKPKNLLFIGGTGLGKTHLSSAVAKTVIDKGYDVMYKTAIGIMSDFEYSRFGNAAVTDDISPTSRYFDCDLLIIDDLGTEISNQFTVSTIYNIIDTRINTGKSMLISTNLSGDELRKRYWDRITSRLFGEFDVIPFAGIDVRAQKAKIK